MLGSAQTVNQIIFWGGYYPGNTPLAVDDFTVNIYHDNAGVPGTSVYSQSGVVPTDRTDTGVDLFGVDEYLFTLNLPNPPTLAAGTYWVEIFNNTSSIADDFFWETGTLDAVNGIQGSVWDSQTPGVNWILDSSTDLAFQVNYAEAAPPAAIPTLSEWGMVIFTLLAAGIAIRLIRRRKTEI